MAYQEVESTKSPEDWESTVWRYLSTSQLLSILEKGRLRFTRTDKFPDPFEGTLPEKVFRDVEYLYNEGSLPGNVQIDDDGEVIITKNKNYVETYKQSFFHNCWNYKEYESKAMWDSKSKDGEGVAIITTAEKLKQSFSKFTRLPVFIGLVEYGDYREEFSLEYEEAISLKDWKTIHFHKPVEFNEENELRATIPIFPTPEADPINDYSQYSSGETIELDWSKQPSGVDIPIDKSTLIQEVRLSPYSGDWQKKVIEDVLDTYEIDADVSKSEIFG